MSEINFTQDLPPGFSSWLALYRHVMDRGMEDNGFIFRPFKVMESGVKQIHIKRVSIDTIRRKALAEVMEIMLPAKFTNFHMEIILNQTIPGPNREHLYKLFNLLTIEDHAHHKN